MRMYLKAAIRYVSYAHLQDELAQYLEQWETLDGPQLNALQFLAESNGHAAQIAKRFNFNIQIAETGLVFLAHHRYVAPVAGATAARGKKALFALAPKGERYLRERGFIK